MTQEPRQEVELHGRVGEPVLLPVGNEASAVHTWALDLPDEVEQVAPTDEGGRLAVRTTTAGSHVLVATLSEDATGLAMTVLPIRLTVS